MQFNPEEKLLWLIKSLYKPCIFLCRHFPTIGEYTSWSKFGGLPDLPAEIAWPLGRLRGENAKSYPLPFLCQIDFDEFGHIDPRLPTKGLLFVFADVDMYCDWYAKDASDYRKIIYSESAPQKGSKKYPPHPETIPPISQLGPELLPRAFFDAYDANNPLNERIFNEFPIEFMVVNSYPDTDIIRETPEWHQLRETWKQLAKEDESFFKEFGEEDLLGVMDAHDQLMITQLEHRMPQYSGEAKGNNEAAARLLTTTVEMACIAAYQIERMANGKIKEENERAARANNKNRQGGQGLLSLFKKLTPELPNANSDPIFLNRLAEAQDWLKKLRTLPRQSSLPAQDSQLFQAWYQGLEASHFNSLSNRYGELLFFYAAQLACHADWQQHMPDSLLRTLNGQSTFPPQHQMLGHFHATQYLPSGSEGMVPLLMLSYDSCVGMRICDVGQMHFYISEEDLKARNFENVFCSQQGS